MARTRGRGIGSTSMSPPPYLDPELWTEILRHVPMSERRVVGCRACECCRVAYPPCLPPYLPPILFSSMPSPVAACRMLHVPLVSRHLNEACRDPRLWPDLSLRCKMFLSHGHWRRFIRWLSFRASGIQNLSVDESEVRSLLERHLQSGQLSGAYGGRIRHVNC